MMQRLSQKLRMMMYGRRGMDELNIFLFILCLAANLLCTPLDSMLLYVISMLSMLLFLFRAFSRNLAKRSEENARFLRLTVRFRPAVNTVRDFFGNLFAKDKSAKIYRCPNCGQKLRVPRGRGRLSITCSRCKTQFIRKS